MQFPFTRAIEIDGVTVTHYVGVAMIEADSHGTSPYAKRPEWTVAEIALDGIRRAGGAVVSEQVTLADTHPMHDDMLLWLLQMHRDEIDAHWAAWIGASIDRARSRFVVRPALSIAK